MEEEPRKGRIAQQHGSSLRLDGCSSCLTKHTYSVRTYMHCFSTGIPSGLLMRHRPLVLVLTPIKRQPHQCPKSLMTNQRRRCPREAASYKYEWSSESLSSRAEWLRLKSSIHQIDSAPTRAAQKKPLSSINL